MMDPEVGRLRVLRASALRLRSVVHELNVRNLGLHDPLLQRGACAAWRIARTVSGRLRGHPFAAFQRDAGLGERIGNRVAAMAASFGASSRAHALAAFDGQLKIVSRRLDDARAMAWAPDLSDLLGRSQREFRGLSADTYEARFQLPSDSSYVQQ